VGSVCRAAEEGSDDWPQVASPDPRSQKFRTAAGLMGRTLPQAPAGLALSLALASSPVAGPLVCLASAGFGRCSVAASVLVLPSSKRQVNSHSSAGLVIRCCVSPLLSARLTVRSASPGS